MSRFGLIEAGGTKFILGIADSDHAIVARTRIETTLPADTIAAAIQWFADQGGRFTAIGIASFGPLELNRAAPNWGHVTATPKPGWSGADLAGPFARAFACPVGFQTDVNAAALAEARWGAGAGLGSLLYLTIGTGIGGGLVSDGRLLHGQSHPEMGHIGMPRHVDDHGFAGNCPFHGDCLEGLASGPAIIARWGASLAELPDDHPAHAMIGWYLGRACATFQAVMAPERIVLGGGVMGAPGMIGRVRDAAAAAGGGYFPGDSNQIIRTPGLGENSGLMGALAVADAAFSA
jgi:fructokinase